MGGLYNRVMKRRTMLLGGAALALAPGLAFAGKRPPKTKLHVGGRITHRKKDVDRKKVKFRFAIYRKNMDKDPIWDEFHTLDVTDGRFEVELGKGGSLGTAVEETLPEKLYLGVFILSMGPDVTDLRMAPKLRVDWAGSGTSPCIENEETLNEGGLDEGGICTTTGEGAVAMYINTLQRVPAKGEWVPD